MYSTILVNKLNRIAYDFKDLVEKAIHDVLNQAQYRNTGAGAQSIQVEIIDGDTEKAPQIIIHYADHLLYLNQKKMSWTKLPKMKELLAWAETKRTDPLQAKKLAWATAWDKKKNDTWKAKAWRKKSLSNVLKQMNKLILEAFEKAIDEEMQQAINNVLKR